MIFKVTWTANGISYSTPNINANGAKDLSNLIYQGLVAAGGGDVQWSSSPGSVVVHLSHGAWDEYQITFPVSTSSSSSSGSGGGSSGSGSGSGSGSSSATTTVYSSFTTVCTTNPDNVAMFALLDYNNYPLFYDSRHPVGSIGSGRYTCYMRSLGYQPWSYWTGKTNPGDPPLPTDLIIYPM